MVEETTSRTDTPLVRRAILAALAVAAGYGVAEWLLREREPRLVEFIAHRGGAATAPENTLGAFRAAIDAGVLAWEFDVQCSRDGELMVIHDETLERTTDGAGMVKDHSYAELKKLDAGSWFGDRWRGERVPTLREVLGLAQEVDAHLFIELKSPHLYPGIERRVVDLLAEMRYGYNSVILSFDAGALARVHQLNPALEIDLNYVGHVFGNLPPVPGLGAIGPEWRVLAANPARVREAHQARQRVYPWTVNTRRTLDFLTNLGVDGVISDRLDLSPGA
jgi:glycerophosphoryl diester phosphodiesterase